MDMDQGGKPRWGRRLGIAAVILVVLLVAVYFVATSAFFLKSVILPKVGKSMNARNSLSSSVRKWESELRARTEHA